MKTLFFALSVILLCALTLVVLVLGDGNVGLALLPTLLFAALYAMWKLPLRYPLLVVSFLALTLENPAEAPACDQWKSPLFTVGAVFMVHLNLTFEQKWMIFSGLDMALVCLLILALYRWARRSTIDSAGRVAVAHPIRLFVLAIPLAVLGMWLWGMARSGTDFASSLWQVQRVIYLPLVFLLFAVALRGSRDYAALGKLLVLIAVLKAVLAIYIRETVAPPAKEKALEYATTHPDSMLFAAAVCLVVALLYERFDKKHLHLALLLLPLLVAGMVANTRRIAWVELGLGLFTFYMLVPWSRARRAIARVAILASPVLLAYFAMGWRASSESFAPVELARSMIDARTDASTAWRDWENYDLVYTVREHPFVGSGYGHGYNEIVKLPDISDAYPLYRYLPHDSFLGIWVSGGILGFFAVWTVYAVGIFFGVRVYRRARRSSERIAALTSTALIVIYLTHSYGDMGLGTWVSVFTIAPALVVIGQLAVSTGVWPGQRNQQPVEHKRVVVLSVQKAAKEGAVTT